MAKTPGTGIKIGTHFSPRFKRPIDDRFQFDTIAEMAGFAETALYDGIETFVSQNKKTYKYLSTNPIDPTTGRWRLVGSESYTKEESDAKFISVDQKNVADGVAALDASGKIIKSQLNLNKKDVGLDNVDNTADLDKPISKNTQEALDLKANVVDVEADLSTKANKDEVYDKTETDTLLDTKVDKIDGKNLSTNDLTDELKAEYDDAVLLKHSHDNKDLLDTLTDDLIQKWNGKQDLIQYEELPLASAELNGKVYQYIGIETENRKVGNFYKCVEKTTDFYDWVELQPEVESIQKESLPTPTIDLVNKIYQYIGSNVLGSYQKGYFYICVEDTKNLGTYVWKQKNVQPSTEGGSTLERDITANINVGGFTEDDVAPEGMTFTEFTTKLLHVYKEPTLAFTSTASAYLLNKDGGVVAQPFTLTATAIKQDLDIVETWIEDSAGLKLATGIMSAAYIADTNVYDNITYKAFTKDAKKTIDPKTISYEFIYGFFKGISTTVPAASADIKALTLDLTKKDKKSYTFTASNQYLIVAYPASYGNLTKITDQNGFVNFDVWNKTVVAVSMNVWDDAQSEYVATDVDYNVYTTNDKITCSDFKYTFEF